MSGPRLAGTTASAQEYMRCHDAVARFLGGEDTASLRALERWALDRAGVERLHVGEPRTRDEVIASILEARFPKVAAARATLAAPVEEA